MNYRVFLVSDAEEDIFEIVSYIASNDSVGRANNILGKLQETCSSLEHFPHRGHVPPELEKIGGYNFLQIHFKPYRIMYTISNNRVFVLCVLDGRRDLQDLLQRRLLR
jgi:toxin ParE1/3/4